MAELIVIPEKNWQQNPLFWPKQGNLVLPRNQPNVFIGIGVANQAALSQAIPFDELGFLLSAEFIKRQVPNSHVFVLIADQHAWLANHLSINRVRKIIQAQFVLMNRFINTLNFKHWRISKASELFPQARPESYEKMELRDINLFVRQHSVGVKVGWQFSRREEKHRTDEAHFDKLLNDKLVQSLFVKPGMTLNHQKIHESPYICSDPDTRIVASRREDIAQKINTATCNSAQKEAVKNHLRKTVLLFEMLIGKFPNKIRLEEKARLINSIIFS